MEKRIGELSAHANTGQLENLWVGGAAGFPATGHDHLLVHAGQDGGEVHAGAIVEVRAPEGERL